MKVVVIGTRGIPNIQGGVETHCEKLYPILVKQGCDVTIVRRACYTSNDKLLNYEGAVLKDIYAPRDKKLEAIVHTFLAIIYAKRQKADILHMHAIGPALLTPFARTLGLKVIVTHHGPDYNRQKWGKFAQLTLKLGERFAARFANRIIAISTIITNDLKDKYNRQIGVSLILNGVDTAKRITTTNYLDSLGLEKGNYIFTLGRFVEEKGFHNLVEAYSSSIAKNKLKLVIAGDADHESEYSLTLKAQARKEGVILTGFIKGESLAELFSHARIFILPSFHEGLPISLLEAMSYNLDVLISDIAPNREVLSDEACFFNPSNVEELRSKLDEKVSSDIQKISYDLHPYDWDHIAEQTHSLYIDLLKNNK